MIINQQKMEKSKFYSEVRFKVSFLNNIKLTLIYFFYCVTFIRAGKIALSMYIYIGMYYSIVWMFFFSEYLITKYSLFSWILNNVGFNFILCLSFSWTLPICFVFFADLYLYIVHYSGIKLWVSLHCWFLNEIFF